MNISKFTNLLAHPENISEKDLHSLEKITTEYPYFQAAWALRLNMLKQHDSEKYHALLKRTASHTTDRFILFDLTSSVVFSQHAIAKTINKKKTAIHTIPVTSEELIAQPINKQENEAVLDPQLFSPKTDDPTILKKRKRKEDPKMGNSIAYNENTLYSFTEWLKQTSTPHTGSRSISKKTVLPEKKQKEKFKLIDKFIIQNPKIIPKKVVESSINLADNERFEKMDLMTETLAKIYMEQRKFKKAIRAYKILSLKYPEKSGFFADQIKLVKRLQQNND